MYDVSVIIPVSKSHLKYLPQAIASVRTQEGDIELIVVNDSEEDIGDLQEVTVIQSEEPTSGPSHCRNLGASIATGEAFIFLDADDMLLPGAVRELWKEYKKTGNIIYGDLIRSDDGTIMKFQDPYYGDDIKQSCLYKPNRHVTCLIPSHVHHRIGGWDEEIPLWEDIEYVFATAVEGVCETHIDYPTHYYRIETGERRLLAEKHSDIKEAAQNYLYNKYNDYYKGRKEMACKRGCGQPKFQKPNPQQQQRLSNQQPNILQLMEDVDVFIEYIDPRPETRTIKGPHTGAEYRMGGSVQRNRIKKVGYGDGEVHPLDAQTMVTLVRQSFNQFKILMKEKEKPIVLQPRQPAAKPAKNARDLLHAHIEDDEMAALRAEIAAAHENR